MIPLYVFVLSLLVEGLLLGAYCVWLIERHEAERAGWLARHAAERETLLNRLMARDLSEYHAFAQGTPASPPPPNRLAAAVAAAERATYGGSLEMAADESEA